MSRVADSFEETTARSRSPILWIVLLALVVAGAMAVPLVSGSMQTGDTMNLVGFGSFGDKDISYYHQRMFESQRRFGWGENPGMRARDGVVYDRDSYNAGPRFDNAREAALLADQNYRTFTARQTERNRLEGFDGTVWDRPITAATPFDTDISAPPINGDPVPLGYGYSQQYPRLLKNPYTDDLRAEFGWAATPPSAQYGYGSGSYPTRQAVPLDTRTARTRAKQGSTASFAKRRLRAERSGNTTLGAYLDGYREGCRWIIGTGGTVGIDSQTYTMSDCLLNEPRVDTKPGMAATPAFRLGYRTACQVMFAASSTGTIQTGNNSVSITHGQCERMADTATP